MSNPEKKEKFDKYGTVDESDFDFDHFMQEFDFGDVFGLFMNDVLLCYINIIKIVTF